MVEGLSLDGCEEACRQRQLGSTRCVGFTYVGGISRCDLKTDLQVIN